MGKIMTYSGRHVDPTCLFDDEISITDIAHSLSRQARFNGATEEIYTVAQHSIYVSYVCDPKNALWGLLHDAPEAYIGDIVRPVKDEIKALARLEDTVMRAICLKYGLPQDHMPEDVLHADNMMLDIELSALFYGSVELEIYSPDMAKKAFLNRFHDLTLVEGCDHAEEAAIRTQILTLYHKKMSQNNGK
jgi:hypothetical protein